MGRISTATATATAAVVVVARTTIPAFALVVVTPRTTEAARRWPRHPAEAVEFCPPNSPLVVVPPRRGSMVPQLVPIVVVVVARAAAARGVSPAPVAPRRGPMIPPVPAVVVVGRAVARPLPRMLSTRDSAAAVSRSRSRPSSSSSSATPPSSPPAAAVDVPPVHPAAPIARPVPLVVPIPDLRDRLREVDADPPIVDEGVVHLQVRFVARLVIREFHEGVLQAVARFRIPYDLRFGGLVEPCEYQLEVVVGRERIELAHEQDVLGCQYLGCRAIPQHLEYDGTAGVLPAPPFLLLALLQFQPRPTRDLVLLVVVVVDVSAVVVCVDVVPSRGGEKRRVVGGYADRHDLLGGAVVRRR